jgi:hypothetical protein
MTTHRVALVLSVTRASPAIVDRVANTEAVAAGGIRVEQGPVQSMAGLVALIATPIALIVASVVARRERSSLPGSWLMVLWCIQQGVVLRS